MLGDRRAGREDGSLQASPHRLEIGSRIAIHDVGVAKDDLSNRIGALNLVDQRDLCAR